MINIIYALKNKINDKVYVGQTWLSLQARWNNGWGYEGSHKINNAIVKYGKDNFYYEILALCSNQTDSDLCEMFFINYFDCIDNGYNIALGGNSVMFGRKHTDESKLKMSESHKGNTAHLGKPHSEETKKRLSLLTSKQIKEKGHPFAGKTLSEKSRKKLSLALKGKAPNSTSFKKGESDARHKNRLGKTWKLIDGKRVWSNK